MDSKILHDLKSTPFNERETFNNAILLLTMVKSEYYYIVGFSRPDNKVEIGFDFEDKLYGRISEIITMDFGSRSGEIQVSATLSNIVFEGKTAVPFTHKDNFKINGGYLYYERLFEKDKVIPVSMDRLSSIILTSKKDIEEFLNQSMAYILKNFGKKQ